MNPLFTEDPEGQKDDHSYLLDHSQGRTIQPLHSEDANAAADLVRRKIDALFTAAPNARTELAEAEAAKPPRSKHQEFMHNLSTSGKSLAEIQIAWHDYYAKLDDEGKRSVWQEFYSANKGHAALTPAQPSHQPHPQPRVLHHPQPAHNRVVVSEHVIPETTPEPAKSSGPRSVASIKRQVLKKVRASSKAQIKAKQHLQSLAFGVGLGALVLLVFLFGFFNEVVIAPFIQPSGHASATPIILSQDNISPTATPEVIIPKINVELPVVYGDSVTESDIEDSLEDGVAHYPSTSVPGQQGNAAFFGHSSNNIFNKGKYKFAFVLLHELVPGDIFYLTYNGKVYTYRVFQKQVVEPTETWVLNPVEGKTATATLITCDPPGTSLRRLVVWGEQIDPDPNVNASAPAPTQTASTSAPELVGNGPTLWTRFWRWVF